MLLKDIDVNILFLYQQDIYAKMSSSLRRNKICCIVVAKNTGSLYKLETSGQTLYLDKNTPISPIVTLSKNSR